MTATIKTFTKADDKVIKAAIKVLKREFKTKCKDRALGCFNCIVWQMIEDLEYLREF